MSIFENISFYIAPATSEQTNANKDNMVSILRHGNGVYKSVIDKDVTHIICNQDDFPSAQQKVDDSMFCSFVTPKWVFISNALHYNLPVVCISPF